MKPTLAVMAAGLGSRYGGYKQIEPMGQNGELMMEYAVYDAVKAGFGRVVFILKEDFKEDFKKRFGDRIAAHVPVTYVCQRLEDKMPAGAVIPESRKKPWGTGHAVLCLQGVVDEPFCVINSDDFYGYQTFEAVSQFLQGTGKYPPYSCCMAGFRIENTLSVNGTVSRGVCQTSRDGHLIHIVERSKIKMIDGVIIDQDTGVIIPRRTPVSMNVFGFPAGIISDFQVHFDIFLHMNDMATAEFFLPFAVDIMLNAKAASVEILPVESRWYGVTYREDIEPLKNALAEMIQQGMYPEKLWD